jgi:hypothetical protein
LSQLGSDPVGAKATYSRLVGISSIFLTRLRAAAEVILAENLTQPMLDAIAAHVFNDPADLFSDSPTLEAARLVTSLVEPKGNQLDEGLAELFFVNCKDPLLARWVFVWLKPNEDTDLPQHLRQSYAKRLEDWSRASLVGTLMNRGFGAFSEVLWSWYHADRQSLGRGIQIVAEAHKDAFAWLLLAAYGQYPVTDDAPADAGWQFFEHVDRSWLRKRLASFSPEGLDKRDAVHVNRMVSALSQERGREG